MNRKLIILGAWVFLVALSNIQIFRLHGLIVNLESEYTDHAAKLAAEIGAGRVMSPEQQGKLLVAAADRSFELEIFKYSALAMGAMLTTILSLVAFMQLTSHSRPTRQPPPQKSEAGGARP